MAQTLIFIFCPLYSLSFYSLQFLPCRVSLGSTNGKRFCLWVHDRHCGEGRLPLNALNLCVQYYRLSAKSAKTEKFHGGLTWSVIVRFGSNFVQRSLVSLFTDSECFKWLQPFFDQPAQPTKTDQ